MNEPRITLTVLPAEAQPAAWQGWQPLTPLPPPEYGGPDLDAPEPLEPQGAYGVEVAKPPAAQVPAKPPAAVELLAPAGGPEAAFAAFHYGADAIYLGLKKFSARAEAENFTLEELDEITAYAHSLQPRRRVFVTINTLIRQDEVAELVETVAALAEIGVDALIIQDLGVYHLVRRYFPELELHASTQLAVHNRAGAAILHRLGFHRVVLARELTFEEVRDITGQAGVETEVFIHGALCYSYSGLCLFSSQTLGRSGNRGKCAYSCRDSYDVTGAPATLRDGSEVKRDPRQGFPFSMKDLALPDHIPTLGAAGVSCFKIEGRKKSPLYVATTTDYYRKLLDGRLRPEERPQLEADMQTVFSRPWTGLFLNSHKDKEVADRDTVGHRGTLIGRVEQVQVGPEPRLRFRTGRALERHDGLQVDLPTLGKPFGFAVERLWVVSPGKQGKRQDVISAPAGALVEVTLPREHPELPRGAPVYCSSSQAVKQRYRYQRPKPGLYRVRQPVEVTVTVTAEAVTATGRVAGLEVSRSVAGTFTPAREPAALQAAVQSAFDKLGDTGLELASLTLHNDAGLFVPVSRLNPLRRDLTAALEDALRERRAEQVRRIQTECRRAAGVSPLFELPASTPFNSGLTPAAGLEQTLATRPQGGFRWLLKVDRSGFLDALEDRDLDGVAEVIIDIARDHPTVLQQRLDAWAARIGRDRLRLALPPLTRFWEEKGLRHKIRSLRAAGWNQWEAGNLSAWHYLDLDPLQPAADLDLAADWSLYAINRLAVRQLLDMGVKRFALSPEDGLGNMRSLLAEFAERACVIVHQDTPQFLAESCAYANLIGGCPGKANCRFESMEMVSSHGEKVTALDYHCRTIVLNQEPYCLAHRLTDLAAAGAIYLRADFIYRPYEAVTVRDRWRLVRAGKFGRTALAANFERGLL